MRSAVHSAMPAHTMGDPPKGGIDRATVARVWGFTRPYRWMLVGFLATTVSMALITLVPPLFLRRIIDEAIPSSDRGLLHLLALIIAFAAIAEAGLALIDRWWSARIGEGLIFDLRAALFDHVQRMPIAFFTRTQTGALISRLNNDVIGAQRAVTGTLGTVASNAIVLVTTFAALMALEWRLTLLAIAVVPLFIIPAKRVGRRLAGLTREGMDLNASMNTNMTERFNVSGAQLVKLFGNHDVERDHFAGQASRVRDIGIRSAMYGRTFNIALGLVGAIATVLIYWLGGLLAIDGTMTIGTLTAMSLLVVRLYGPLTSLTNARVDVMSAFVSFERVFEVLDAPNPLTDREDAVVLDNVRGEVEFDQVVFRYPAAAEVSLASLELDRSVPLSSNGTATVLHEVSVHVQPGQLVALVGPSGAGKTTMASLLPRLYDVSGGAVRVDGHDIRAVTQESLRAAIGVVSQDPHLFHDTLEANLRYARPSATHDEIVAACDAARISQVIDALPDGYQTVVGERGYRLSGGEKQRMAIARMLVKDPAIVVLDEATSHLDSENEALVQEALTTALQGRTAFVIAHRLSTITAADLIVVMDNGRIIERGTHRELLAADGLYASHYRTLIRGDSLPADR